MSRPVSTDHERLRKIRKLLALAEDPGATPAEAAAFTEKAAMLMARHGIDEALVAEHEGSTRIGNRRIALPAPYARDKATLVSAIAMALRCKAVMITTNRTLVVQVFGLDGDLRNVETLFTSLLVQASHELGGTAIPRGEHPAAFRRSWWSGFAIAVHTRLQEVSRTAESQAESDVTAGRADRADSAGAPSVALVLAHRADEIDDEVAKTYPELKRGRTRRLSGGGHAAGYQSGQRVDLGTLSKLPVA